MPQEWQVTFGDSDKVRLGDHVIAIGNPFGLARTVTYGGISALHRNIRSGDFDDFIQIDAPINRGNSGGPTFNTKGEFIAMNTAIFSPSGGSAGIGFAIPSNMVKIVSEAIINNPDHKMHYALLGANIGVVDKDVAQEAGLDSPKGVMVAGIRSDSPAARAGLKKGDIILSLNGKPVEGEVAEDVQRFSSSIAFMKAGDQVAIEYFRDGQTHQMTATLGQRPDRVAVIKEDTAGEDGPAFQPGFLESIPDESFLGFVEQFEMGMGLMQQQIDRLQSQANKLKSKKEQGMAALKQEMERRGLTPPPFLTPGAPTVPNAAPELHDHMPGMPMPSTPAP